MHRLFQFTLGRTEWVYFGYFSNDLLLPCTIVLKCFIKNGGKSLLFFN